MIESVQFKNFKVLRDATLPLSRFTLIVGPNGSGKSTALQGIYFVANPSQWFPPATMTAGLSPENPTTMVNITLSWGGARKGIISVGEWSPKRGFTVAHRPSVGLLPGDEEQSLKAILGRIKIISLDERYISASQHLQPNMEFDQHGGSLAVVLDRLRDQDPERFELLNEELGRWFPEFDRVLFDTPSQGQRAFLLRTCRGHCKIPATDLSQGTLMAFALLTLAYLPEPPPLVCLEEPDRGIHPRLLRRIQDALYRLSYPEDFGEKREPVQVIATTHSPYFLDLYKDHPEEIVIAQKTEDGARFERLSDHPDIEEILEDAPLGDVWFSGILGGVPAEQ